MRGSAWEGYPSHPPSLLHPAPQSQLDVCRRHRASVTTTAPSFTVSSVLCSSGFRRIKARGTTRLWSSFLPQVVWSAVATTRTLVVGITLKFHTSAYTGEFSGSRVPETSPVRGQDRRGIFVARHPRRPLFLFPVRNFVTNYLTTSNKSRGTC